MINCANSVSSHKPFQKGQKSKSNYNYYQKILLDTKYLMKKKKKKKRTELKQDYYENKLKNQKNTRLWIDETKPERKITKSNQKKSLKKSFEKVLKSKSKNQNKKYTKI